MHPMLCSAVILVAFYSTHCRSEDHPSQRHLGDYVRPPEDFFSPPPVAGPPEPAYGYYVITNPFYYRQIYAPAFHPYAGIPYYDYPQDQNSVYDVPYNPTFKGSVSPNYFVDPKIPGNFESRYYPPSRGFPNSVHNPSFSIPNDYAPSYPTTQNPCDEYHPTHNKPPYALPNYFPTSTQTPQLYFPQNPSTKAVTIPTLFTSTMPNIIREEHTVRELDRSNTPSFLSSSYDKSFPPSNVPLFVRYDSPNIIRGESPISVKPNPIYPGSNTFNPPKFNPIPSTSTPLNPSYFYPIPTSTTPLYTPPGSQPYSPSSSTPGYPSSPVTTPTTVLIPSSPFEGRFPTPINTSTESTLYDDSPTSESPPQTHVFYEAPGHESPQ